MMRPVRVILSGAVLILSSTLAGSATELVEEWVVAQNDTATESGRRALVDPSGDLTVAAIAGGCFRWYRYSPDGQLDERYSLDSSYSECKHIDLELYVDDLYWAFSGNPYIDPGSDKLEFHIGNQGAHVSVRTKGGPFEDRLKAMAIDQVTGKAYVTGGMSRADGSVSCATTSKDGSDPVRIDDVREQACERIAVDSAGAVIVAGWSRSPSTIVVHKWLWSDEPLGAWAESFYFDSDDSTLETVTGLAVDQSDDIYVIGSVSSRGNQVGSEWLIFKVDGESGELLWSNRLHHGSSRNASPRALAVDGDGAVLVAGGWPSEEEGQYRVVRYNGADGTVSCEGVYDAVGSNDEALALALGPGTQKLAVTGRSNGVGSATGGGNGGTSGYATVVFSRACKGGELALEAVSRYDEPGCCSQGANAIGLGTDGQVYVSGLLNSRQVTIKYRLSGPFE